MAQKSPMARVNAAKKASKTKVQKAQKQTVVKGKEKNK